MCLTEKVLRIYFEQNQLCIQVWRFTIGKFNRDVLVSNMKKKKSNSRNFTNYTNRTSCQNCTKRASNKATTLNTQSKTNPAAASNAQITATSRNYTKCVNFINHANHRKNTYYIAHSSICTFYKIYHNRAMCINFINHTNYGFAWAQYTNNTTKARIDFSKSEILNTVISLESSGVFTCTKLYESSFKYPIYWYNF